MSISVVDNLPGAWTVKPASSHQSAQRGAEAAEGSFQGTLQQAMLKIDKLSRMLIATAFVAPMIEQMNQDPFRTELFHGGFGEEVFSQQLHSRWADDLTTNVPLPLVNVMGDRFKQWLSVQPAETVRRVADIRMDLLG